MPANNSNKYFFGNLHRLTLKFKRSELENEFLESYQTDMLVNIKVAILFSIVIYALFSILDYQMAPEYYEVFTRIRFVYVLPLAILILIFFQLKMFLQFIQILCSLLMILSGLGIVAMVALGGEELLKYYYVGLILVLIFNYDFLKLRFIYATFSGFVVIISYAVVCYYSDISKLTIIMSGFFLVSANFFGMISTYYFEYYARKNFFVNKLLQLERLKTASVNKTLEEKVEERSATLLKLNESLRQAEEKYRTMLERSNDLIWTTNEKDQITFVNHEFEALLQVSNREAESLLFQDIVHDSYADIYNYNLKALKNGTSVDYLCKAKSKEQKELWLQIHASPFFDNGVFSGVVSFAMNVTESSVNEVRRKVILRIAEKINSPTELQVLIKYINDEINKVLRVDDLFIILQNDEGRQSFFFSNPDLSSHLGEDIVQLKVLEQVVDNGKSVHGNSQTIQNGLGGSIYTWLGVPLVIDGHINGSLVLLSKTDKLDFKKEDMEMMEIISQYVSQLLNRQKVDAKLHDALEKATESDRLKSTFLSTMSHELRTPLNAIIGFSDLIDENTDHGEVIEYAKLINLSGNHLLKIVKDILNVTLLETGEIVQKTEVFRLHEVTEELKEMFRIEQNEMGKDHLFVSWEGLDKHHECKVRCDKKLLRRVFSNLLKNALKFTSEGGITLGCDVVQEGQSSFLQFCVIDSGLGISPDQKGFIFDLFRQVDDTHTRKFGGIGVGLTVAAKLVNLMGGRIWLDSDSESGSAFYFTLPDSFNQRFIPLVDPLTNDNDHKNLTANKAKMVLVVDDTESSYLLLSVMLSKMNHSSIWAKSGKEAVQIIDANRTIHLVLMDLKMPDMNGYEAVKLIQKNYPSIPVIAQTAFAVLGDRDKALAAGFDDYISKPIMQNEFIKLVNKYI